MDMQSGALILVGIPFLVLAAALLSWYARFMQGLPIIISIPLFVIFPPLFFAFLGGMACCLLSNGLASALEKLSQRRRSARASKSTRPVTTSGAHHWFDY